MLFDSLFVIINNGCDSYIVTCTHRIDCIHVQFAVGIVNMLFSLYVFVKESYWVKVTSLILCIYIFFISQSCENT